MCSSQEEAKYRFLEYNSIIHDIVQYGGGGFSISDVRKLPLYLRKFHYNRLIENNKSQKEKPKGVITEEDVSGDLNSIFKTFKLPEDTFTVKKAPN